MAMTNTTNGITNAPGRWKPEILSSIADGTPLRIMSLGASLVRGEFSTGNVGFRKTMRDELVGLASQPNLFLIRWERTMFNRNLDINKAGQRMEALVDY
ncbi:hypothetical protein GGR54DRAFT_643449 [Hypoxylon sp. NC1633]|nr:hypothetical protein GGR54DRAFT_643449 [Hypoxylon sp. NC1633]